MSFNPFKSKPKVDKSDVSRIVISFNNANGGHMFAHWLRNELMKSLGYFAQNSVYLDNVAARYNGTTQDTIHHKGLGGKGVHWTQDPLFAEAMVKGVPLVGPNMYGGKNYATIGGAHDAWEEWWTEALSTSKVLIQLQTEDYAKASVLDGTPCARELAKINRAIGSNSINVLALRFNDNPKVAIGLKNGGNVMPMICAKVSYGLGQGGSIVGRGIGNKSGIAFQDAYKISDSDLKRVVKYCKSKGC